LPVYEHSGDCLPEAERASKEVLSLPLGPIVEASTQRLVVQHIMSGS
jgi:dTDP-4-amino-4,6-dideoxygalactose transaminase